MSKTGRGPGPLLGLRQLAPSPVLSSHVLVEGTGVVIGLPSSGLPVNVTHNPGVLPPI